MLLQDEYRESSEFPIRVQPEVFKHVSKQQKGEHCARHASDGSVGLIWSI